MTWSSALLGTDRRGSGVEPRLHAAAKTPDGLLLFDTCPSEEAYHTFFAPGGPAMALFEKHSLVPTSREDHPVVRAYGAYARLDEETSG
jgi:hypothetical protein